MPEENGLVPDPGRSVEAPATPPEPQAANAVATEAAPVRTRRSPAIWWGAVLVLGGVVLLVSQFVPGIELWRYWPLIIIAFGIRAMFGPGHGGWTIRHLGEGLSTIAFGLVFLGQMVGYLNWDVWLNILRLWPLLLVSLGLEIVGKGLKSEWVRAFSSVVIIGGLAYGALVMTSTAGWPLSIMPAGESQAFDLSAALPTGVEKGTVRIEGGVGSLSLVAGDRLATAEGRSPFDPVFETDASGRTADVVIGLGSHTWGPTAGDSALNVTLARDVVWDLDVSAGVTQYEVDLRELMLSGLQFDAGVSDGTLTLGVSDAGGANGPVSVEVESGVSALRIRVPENDSVRVTINKGLTGVKMRGDWTKADEGDVAVYESDRFQDTGAYWDIEIQAGIGGITVEYY